MNRFYSCSLNIKTYKSYINIKFIYQPISLHCWPVVKGAWRAARARSMPTTHTHAGRWRQRGFLMPRRDPQWELRFTSISVEGVEIQFGMRRISLRPMVISLTYRSPISPCMNNAWNASAAGVNDTPSSCRIPIVRSATGAANGTKQL